MINLLNKIFFGSLKGRFMERDSTLADDRHFEAIAFLQDCGLWDLIGDDTASLSLSGKEGLRFLETACLEPLRYDINPFNARQVLKICTRIRPLPAIWPGPEALWDGDELSMPLSPRDQLFDWLLRLELQHRSDGLPYLAGCAPLDDEDLEAAQRARRLLGISFEKTALLWSSNPAAFHRRALDELFCANDPVLEPRVRPLEGDLRALDQLLGATTPDLRNSKRRRLPRRSLWLYAAVSAARCDWSERAGGHLSLVLRELRGRRVKRLERLSKSRGKAASGIGEALGLPEGFFCKDGTGEIVPPEALLERALLLKRKWRRLKRPTASQRETLDDFIIACKKVAGLEGKTGAERAAALCGLTERQEMLARAVLQHRKLPQSRPACPEPEFRRCGTLWQGRRCHPGTVNLLKMLNGAEHS